MLLFFAVEVRVLSWHYQKYACSIAQQDLAISSIKYLVWYRTLRGNSLEVLGVDQLRYRPI